MNYLIVLCIVLAAVDVYFILRSRSLGKEVGNQEFLVDAKNDIIENLNADKKMLKAQIDSAAAKRKDLEDQVSMLVSQINKTGVVRNDKGRFVKVN